MHVRYPPPPHIHTVPQSSKTSNHSEFLSQNTRNSQFIKKKKLVSYFEFYFLIGTFRAVADCCLRKTRALKNQFLTNTHTEIRFFLKKNLGHAQLYVSCQRLARVWVIDPALSYRHRHRHRHRHSHKHRRTPTPTTQTHVQARARAHTHTHTHTHTSLQK